MPETYRLIAETETDAEAPITSDLMKALQKNLIASFEGASGAPRLEFAAMNTWYVTPGGIGTYVIAVPTTAITVNYAYGDTLAGSSLLPTGVIYSSLGIGNGNGTLTYGVATGSALSGTWQCMGVQTGRSADFNTGTAGSDQSYFYGACLWQRIA